MTFENSEFYKKALKEYQEQEFKHLLNPDNVIIVESDMIYLFYNKKPSEVNKFCNELVKYYEEDEQVFPKHLWYEKPIIVKYTFMGVEYEAIVLWFDKEYWAMKDWTK